jgi:hypothetical protein
MSSPTSTSRPSISPVMKKPSAACCLHADAGAAEVAVVAEAAEAAQAAGPAAAASVVALALAVPLLRRWHAQGAAHHGAVAAGARQPRSLTVYRQVAISLAGLGNDPADLLFLLRRSLRPAGQLADGERVCSNLFEEGRSSSAHKSGRAKRPSCAGNRT